MLSSHLKVNFGGKIVWVSTEKYCISPALLDTCDSTVSGCFIINPLLSIPVGYVLLANKLAECFWTIEVTSKFVSKIAPFKNCCVAEKLLPVYQTPPPCVNSELSIDPVVPVAKLDVIHSVCNVLLSL